MSDELNILLTNDDGYQAGGIHSLADMMRQFGRITAVAPKFHQSGMSMAVSMGGRAIAYKELPTEDGVRWSYLDATPASCVKYGLDADFSVVNEYFPGIFRKLWACHNPKSGIYYNVNFPNIPASAVKGIRVGHQGLGHWEKEFKPWDAELFAKRGVRPEDLGHTSFPKAEEGETLYMMVGEFKDDSPVDDILADHHILADGYISIVAHNINSSDHEEIARLNGLGFNEDF